MNNQCEICQTEIPEAQQRCKLCKDRYNSDGTAYVVYCDFWIFRPIGLSKDDHSCDKIFWVADHKIQQRPAGFEWLSPNIEFLEDELLERANLELISITKHELLTEYTNEKK
ncbi:MAG: hypothetical protein RIC03_12445 [Cyclobacteriaceae bacterium]